MAYPVAESADQVPPPWVMWAGRSPIVAAAIHNGHDVRPEIAAHIAVAAEERRREEDPFTDRFTQISPRRIVVNRSRFEVDLNRPVEEAVCLDPKDCWGLRVWKRRPSPELIDASRRLHSDFYTELDDFLSETKRQHERFVVLDIHSYNHMRAGPEEPPEDPARNPDVNVGTGSLNRARWGALVDRFIADLAAQPAHLDVRENVKFRGRYLAAWIHKHFPEDGCCLAIEFKKTFMNEWTGRIDESRMQDLISALTATLPGLKEELVRA
jgi:N-formylglutamate deformylase